LRRVAGPLDGRTLARCASSASIGSIGSFVALA
jgi:hypothetical protein